MRKTSRTLGIALGIFSIAAGAQAQVGQVGMNLNKLSDFSRQWTFVDAFKMSRPWVDQNFQSGTIALDANGWVASLSPGQMAQALMFFDGSGRYPTTPNCVASPSAANCYVLRFEGSGTVTFGAGASIVANPNANRFFVNVPAGSGIILRITATNPANPVRNIRFVMAGFEATADAQPFHPTFLARLAPFKVIRFMDFGATNNTDVEDFSQRKTLLTATQVADDADGIESNDRGVAYEYMVDLCNQLDADMWVNVPHRATDDYVTQLATLVRDRLEAGRRVYIEYSNEIWNSQFLQGGFAEAEGLALGLDNPRNNAFISRLRFQARRSVEIFDIFESVFGGTSRIVRVIATQAANAFTAQEALSFENAFLKTDALAVAPYMDGAGRIGSLANLTSLSVNQIFSELRTDLVGTATDQVRKMMQDNADVVAPLVNADGAPLRLITYEGGQHLLALGPNSGGSAANNLLDNVNRAPEMRDLYHDYLCQWKAVTGGDLFMHFNDVFAYGQSGRWGALEFQDQDPATAPKFMGLSDYIADPACNAVEPLLEPVRWTSVVNAQAFNDGQPDNRVTKTSTTTKFDAGAISLQEIGDGDGYVEFSTWQNTTAKVCGLGNVNTSQRNIDVEFGFDLNANGRVRIREGRTLIVNPATGNTTWAKYKAGAVFRVAVDNGKVKYFRDGVLLFTSSKRPVYPLTVDTSFGTPNGSISGAQIEYVP